MKLKPSLINKQLLSFKETCSRSCSCKLNGRRIKEHMLQTHGVVNPSLLQAVKDKKVQTCRSNFGVDYPQQSSEVRDKLSSKLLERY